MSRYSHRPVDVEAFKVPEDIFLYGMVSALDTLEQLRKEHPWFRYRFRGLCEGMEVRNPNVANAADSGPGSAEWAEFRGGDFIVKRETGCVYPMAARVFYANYALSALPDPRNVVSPGDPQK